MQQTILHLHCKSSKLFQIALAMQWSDLCQSRQGLMPGLVCHMHTLILDNLSDCLCSLHPCPVVLGGKALHQQVDQARRVVQPPHLLHQLPVQLTDPVLNHQLNWLANCSRSIRFKAYHHVSHALNIDVLTFSLTWQEGQPSARQEAAEALQANVCRQTGYKSIPDCDQPSQSGMAQTP